MIARSRIHAGIMALGVGAGSLIGTCGDVVTTRGAPSEWNWLLSRVSRTRMNLSESIYRTPLFDNGAMLR
jgi:hypothetical protein